MPLGLEEGGRVITREQHLTEAERLLELADRPSNHPDGSKHYARMAQVHALLALVPDEIYLDALQEQIDRLGSLPEET